MKPGAHGWQQLAFFFLHKILMTVIFTSDLTSNFKTDKY